MTERREDAVAQVKKRLEAQVGALAGEANVQRWAERIFDRAVFYVRQFHREHQWDTLPREKKQLLDEQILPLFEWQDTVSKKVLDDEHKMTLVGFFIAIGIERPIANAVVDYIVEQDAQSHG